jgi:hypothetical protein
VWPLEGRRDVLRIGAHRVERWVSQPDGLVCVAQANVAHSARAFTDASGLITALKTVVSTDVGTKPLLRADLVLESAWLPVTLFETGPSLWSRSQVEALLRHRLARLFDAAGEPVATWELLIDHRAGEAQGLGFGLPPAIKTALSSASAELGARWTSMQPAFTWGWRQLRHARKGLNQRGWWLWREQDRTLVCHVEGGRVRAMNAGVSPLGDAASCRRAIDIERVRLGVDVDGGRGIVAGWLAVLEPAHDGTLAWASLAAAASASVISAPAHQPSLQARRAA